MEISVEDRKDMLLYAHGWCEKLSVGSFLVALFQIPSVYPTVLGVGLFCLGMYFKLKVRRIKNANS